jgi:hypothetical protein
LWTIAIIRALIAAALAADFFLSTAQPTQTQVSATALTSAPNWRVGHVQHFDSWNEEKSTH